jgi:hypothetical protein
MIVVAPTATSGAESKKTVADPCISYLSMMPLWKRSRAVCNGERFVKDYDNILDVASYANLLIPFSPSMSQEQYDFYKSEAELPGIVSQYAKIIVGGLLRKQPTLELPEGIPEGASEWILHHFAQDSSPLIHFLDQALWEEVQSSRAWVYVDYPFIDEASKEDMTDEEFKELKPYPVLWNAETVINWRVATSSKTGTQELTMIITRSYEEKVEEGQFHPTLVDTVRVHEIVEGLYQIRVFVADKNAAGISIQNGELQQNYGEVSGGFRLDKTIDTIEANGERLTVIPAWPLNGSIKPSEPILTALVDREVNLYNKVSRRNHLLYGAATYTPYVASDMSDDEFDSVVNSGLGSWLHVKTGDTIGVVETPTAALMDMDRAILATIEEMARMGIRMLSPETDQSGVALEIRNAAQTAQLGTLNAKISNQMADIIAFMINWRYGLKIDASEIKFCLSADFNPAPLGDAWLRLATEWYQSGLIPRTVWLGMLKQNDMIPADYDDDEGQTEINKDEMVVKQKEEMQFAADLQKEVLQQKALGGAKPSAPQQSKEY